MNLSCLLICNLVNEDLTPSTEMNNADQCKVLYDQAPSYTPSPLRRQATSRELSASPPRG